MSQADRLFTRALRLLSHHPWTLYYARWERRQRRHIGGNVWTAIARIEVNRTPGHQGRGLAFFSVLWKPALTRGEIRSLVRTAEFRRVLNELEDAGYRRIGDFDPDQLLKQFPATHGALRKERLRLDAILDRAHPIRYAEWFKDRMRVILREKIAALAKSRGADIAEVPEWQVKTPLQRAVQVLKRHRDVAFASDESLRPVSIIITTLAAQAYKNQTDLVDALISIVEEMPRISAMKAGSTSSRTLRSRGRTSRTSGTRTPSAATHSSGGSKPFATTSERSRTRPISGSPIRYSSARLGETLVAQRSGPPSSGCRSLRRARPLSDSCRRWEIRVMPERRLGGWQVRTRRASGAASIARAEGRRSCGTFLTARCRKT
jgi:hypothetical protein